MCVQKRTATYLFLYPTLYASSRTSLREAYVQQTIMLLSGLAYGGMDAAVANDISMDALHLRCQSATTDVVAALAETARCAMGMYRGVG